MNIDYLANVRLPTTRAHGIQIMKTCEALAAAGASVRLIIPDKRHTIGGTDDPFLYYRVERNFEIVRIQTLDLLGQTEALGGLFYKLDLASFLLALAFSNTARKDAVLYARDPVLFLPFFPSRRFCAEVHDIPKNPLFFPMLKRAERVFALTKLLVEDLVSRGCSAARMVVAPDGIDSSDFENPESRDTARTRLTLPVGKRIALYVGRLDGWKGVETLYACAPFLPENIQIVIIGGQSAEVEVLRTRYPHVLFLGARPYTELKNNQQVADVLVLPNTAKETVSARYTSPLKLFSYMTSGVPLVASDLPSIREVLNETMAVLVKPDSAKALAEGIKQVVSNPEAYRDRAVRAQEEVKRYTWGNRANTILTALSPHD